MEINLSCTRCVKCSITSDGVCQAGSQLAARPPRWHGGAASERVQGPGAPDLRGEHVRCSVPPPRPLPPGPPCVLPGNRGQSATRQAGLRPLFAAGASMCPAWLASPAVPSPCVTPSLRPPPAVCPARQLRIGPATPIRYSASPGEREGAQGCSTGRGNAGAMPPTRVWGTRWRLNGKGGKKSEVPLGQQRTALGDVSNQEP